jgi:hypothetical protein
MKGHLLAAVFGVSALALAAHAAETDYKFTWCGLGKNAMLTASPDLTIMTGELRGMVTPESGFKPLENMAVRCMGYQRIMQGKLAGSGACVMTNPAGDTLIGESTDAPDKPSVWTFLGGTGKFQGISGSGTYQMTAMSKPTADGTFEFCLTPTGKYTLAK